MEKYKFKIRKIKENMIEIEAENKGEVLKKLAGYLATNDKSFCKKISKTKEGFYIFLNEISNETRQTIIDDYDEINEDVVRYLLSDNKDYLKEYDENFYEKNSKKCEENVEDIEDDLPTEYTEICCDNFR